MNVLHVLGLSRARSGLLALTLFPLPASVDLHAEPAPWASHEDWHQWRGPARDGTVPGSDWPSDLSGLELEWRSELGKGYSGPLVVGDLVVVTESADEGTERARAFSRLDGAERWSISWPGRGKVPFFAARNGDWIRSTPVHDGEALYVGGMEEVLLKLDATTGRELWRIDFPARFGTAIPEFGFVSSPLLDGEAIFVQAANSILRLDRFTGETIWRQLESSADSFSSGAFSSPVLAEVAGRRQLLVQTREILFGLDPESGEILWDQPVPNFRGMNILTPMVFQDQVFTSSHRHGTYLYAIEDSGDGFGVREVWRNKVQGYMSSPVIIDGHAYLHLGNGRLACIELATGREQWISKPFGNYWSIAVQQDKLLVLDAGGELLLLRANPLQVEVLDARQVSDQSTWAHIAVSGDQVIVRALQGLSVYRWRRESDQSELSVR